MIAIQSENLTKIFDDKEALYQLSFSIQENKMVGLIGRNGAGKTTFFRTCAGHLHPTTGELKVLGQNPFDNLEVLSNLILIDAEMEYPASLSLKEILQIGSIGYSTWDAAFAEKLMRYFELPDKRKYRKLSRGMKTQFNLVMALSSRARITLLDEPTLGLDAAVRKEFYGILLKDYMEHPRSIVISSHLLSEIESMLEEIVLIKEGTQVMHKTMDEMQEYGICLNGKRDALLPFIEKKTVLDRKNFGNSVIAAIHNDLTGEELAYLARQSVDVSKVRVEDVCIYLTRNGKGGGFDVFEG